MIDEKAAVLNFIKKCNEYDFLEEVKNQINKRLVELADDDKMNIVERINHLLPLANDIRGCIPAGENGSPQEMMTDFMNDYMYVVREKTYEYDTIMEKLIKEFDDGIILSNDEIMTKEQFDSILEFIYNDVKMGWKGFDWDW